MPYEKLEALPDSVRNNLPEHAQEIYMKVFNNAWEEYSDPEERRGASSREEAAHKVVWAALKKEYKKDTSGKWVKKG